MTENDHLVLFCFFFFLFCFSSGTLGWIQSLPELFPSNVLDFCGLTFNGVVRHIVSALGSLLVLPRPSFVWQRGSWHRRQNPIPKVEKTPSASFLFPAVFGTSPEACHGYTFVLACAGRSEPQRRRVGVKEGGGDEKRKDHTVIFSNSALNY